MESIEKLMKENQVKSSDDISRVFDELKDTQDNKKILSDFIENTYDACYVVYEPLFYGSILVKKLGLKLDLLPWDQLLLS